MAVAATGRATAPLSPLIEVASHPSGDLVLATSDDLGGAVCRVSEIDARRLQRLLLQPTPGVLVIDTEAQADFASTRIACEHDAGYFTVSITTAPDADGGRRTLTPRVPENFALGVHTSLRCGQAATRR